MKPIAPRSRPPVPPLSLVVLACLVTGVTYAATFTIDSEQSYVTLAGKVSAFGGVYTGAEQGPGSLTAHYAGSFNAEVTESTIEFTGIGLVQAQISGDWQPLANGSPGAAPANYGGQVTDGPLGTSVFGAARQIEFNVTSPSIPLTLEAFSAAPLWFGAPEDSSGSIAYVVAGFYSDSGAVPIAGRGTNNVATTGSLTTADGVQTLTIQIDTDLAWTLLSANDTTVTITGQLVATRPVGGVTDSFEAFVAAHFPNLTDPEKIAPEADPDADGIRNFVEFAFGLNPTATDDSPFSPLKSELNPSNPGERSVRFVRPQGLQGVDYLVQQSDALGNWAPLGGNPQVTDLGNGQEEVVYVDDQPLGPSGARFFTVGVSPTP